MVEARKAANKIEHAEERAIAYCDKVKVYFDDLAILSRPLVQLSVSSEALKTVTYDRKIKSSCSVRFTPENAK